MFQLDSIDEDKRIWNLKENRIIIPLVDGDSLPKEPDKILRAVSLVPQNGDQNSPTENVEHSLAMGFDKNIFEPQSTKNDLLIIQDSDLKLFSCSPDLKNQLGYSFSLVNHNRNESLWENPELKDKPKKWPNENGILEVKDILIYDEKVDEKINFDDIGRKSKYFSTKFKDTQGKEVTEEPNNDKNFQLIINYIPKGCSIISKGETENCEIVVGALKNNKNENAFDKMISDSDMKVPTSNITFKAEVNVNANKPEIRQKNVTFSEKSLPLKKKAKMKKTMICFDSERSLLKQELIKNRQSLDKSSSGSITETQQSSFEEEDNVSDFEKPFSEKTNKRKKTQKNLQKLKKVAVTSPDEEKESEHPVKFEKEACTNLLGFDITKFKNIYDLVEGLRKYRMISIPVWQMLNTGKKPEPPFVVTKISNTILGLKEMDVDILKEIIKKKNEKGDKNYSPQLKAFALVVYFKQPVAFNFLAKICKEGWPSLNVIKEWKLQLNSQQRTNFVGVQQKTTNNTS